MFTLIALALVVAAGYVVYQWLTKAKATAVAEVEQDAQAVEAAVQTDASTAEKVAKGVLDEIKAKL